MRRFPPLRRAPTGAYDVIVVGGGLTGCLIAGRLAMENHRTLLLEDGADIRRRPRWHRTLPCSLIAHRLAGGRYESRETITPPQRTHSDGAARVAIPTPRVLGGGGVMGGRAWTLGDAADWSAPWSFADDILPRVRRLERAEAADAHRGRRGRFLIARPQTVSPFFRSFCAAVSRDAALSGELNRKEFAVRAACGRADVCLDPRTGDAHTTLQSYLMAALALRRPLDVVCDARVGALTADGVVFGADKRAAAGRVVLCAGGVGTPRLLTAVAKALGVGAAAGTNFWDKPQVTLQFRTRLPLSHNCFKDPLVQMFLGLRLRLAAPPPALCSAYDDMVCYWATAGQQEPDVKLIFQPFTLNNDGTSPPGVAHGVQIVVQLVRPKSRGCITADGTVDPKYLTHPDDAKAMRRAVDRVKELSQTLPLSTVFTEMVGERFESAGIYGGASFPVIDHESFLVQPTKNVYVCDESILPNPLLADTLPYMMALGERFVDKFLQKSGIGSAKENANQEKATEARIIY